MLVPVTLHGEDVYAPKNGGPIKVGLENLCSRFGYAHIPSIGQKATMGYDALNLPIRNESVENTIDASFK